LIHGDRDARGRGTLTFQSVDLYRQYFERTVDAFLIIEGDMVVDCNQATVEMLRYRTRDELLRTHPSELSPEFQPDGRRSYEKANEMMTYGVESSPGTGTRFAVYLPLVAPPDAAAGHETTPAVLGAPASAGRWLVGVDPAGAFPHAREHERPASSPGRRPGKVVDARQRRGARFSKWSTRHGAAAVRQVGSVPRSSLLTSMGRCPATPTEDAHMKATDFDFTKDLQFSIESGMTTFRDSRLVVFDAGAMGLLRQEMVALVGWDKARDLILRFGYQHGYSDFMAMKINYQFDNEMELLASGPVIHTWEGIVKATPKEIRFDHETGEFYFTGVWANSYEAEQYLSFNKEAQRPVCWSLSGYASGWCTAFFGSPLIAIEPVCVGMGHDHCEWLIQPPDKFGLEARATIEALKSLQGGR
jgi:hypothetical protein